MSEYLYFQAVDRDKDISIGWNRFFPTIFKLNRFALELLAAVKDEREIDYDDETQAFFKELYTYKFIYDTGKDRSKADFLHMLDRRLARVKEKGDHFYRSGHAYEAMRIYTDECNLTCPYCVNRYKRKDRPVQKDFSQRLELANHCLDQYISRKPTEASEPAETPKPVRVFFNGGEILLEWPTIKAIVNRLSNKYKGVTFAFGLNTNLTLMTEEIAAFLSRHHFEVNISIDGYGQAHDRTRRYRSGKGSFADILKGLEIYRKYFKQNPLPAFQGTIEYIDDFEPAAVYAMEQYGFLTARLAPNLLDVSEEDGRQKARMMGKFLELNTRHRLQVTELFFAKAKERINQDNYRFTFNCGGLSCLPHLCLNLNLSTLGVSHLCGYVRQAYRPLEELAYDIYHPKLWDTTYRWIRQRSTALKKHCLDCHLVGLCSGGCVYTGLDTENRLNKAACAFQEELWRLYINRLYHTNQTPPAPPSQPKDPTSPL